MTKKCCRSHQPLQSGESITATHLNRRGPLAGVTADVFESPVSVVFDQAENRLHMQKVLLLRLRS